MRFALVQTTKLGEGSGAAPLELVLNSGERLYIPADEAILRLVLNILRPSNQA